MGPDVFSGPDVAVPFFDGPNVPKDPKLKDLFHLGWQK